MVDAATTKWLPVNVPLARHTRAWRTFNEYAKALQKANRSADPLEEIMRLRGDVLAHMPTISAAHQAIFRACVLLISDLALQRWRFRISREGLVHVLPPKAGRNREDAKSIIRMQELVKRDAQLRKPSVQAFIKSMERKRLFGDRFVSIFDLMRDGRDLAERLRRARKPNNGDGLSSAIQPYLQFVDSQARCTFTGFRLMDVWRYFRHTWTNQYTSVPGRTMMLLVRDAAAPNHPVMGIASICSPIIQISERDKWIGWHPDVVLDRVRNQPSAKLARWMVTIVDRAIDEIYKADFLRGKLISRWGLEHPKDDDMNRLRRYAAAQRKRHQRYGRRSDFRDRDSRSNTKAFWVEQACTPLFRSKRASSLADLLEIRAHLQQHFGKQFSAQKLRRLAESGSGRRLIGRVVRKAKGDRVGVAMADICVCGAVQPYNAILAGKLTSMLAISPAVVREYKERYASTVSQIASSMAGRPITRAPDLVYFGTTSLYGNGSSQYNRVKIPINVLGGHLVEDLQYRDLGHSEAFGTSQFSDETVEALVQCLRQSTQGERVNSIFGEGVSPRLRKVREGLDLLGMPTHALLQHGRRRTVYGVTLATNTRDYLLGIDRRPKYRFPIANDRSVEAIVAWWCHRWLSSRIESDEVLQKVSEHGHVHPICHGARVKSELMTVAAPDVAHL